MNPYDFIHCLAGAIFLGGFRGSLSVAIFSAFFDASGNKRETALTVVGYVSSISKWDRFGKEWEAILKAEAVSAMHMTHFVSSKGEFSSWRGQTERRRKFISDLSDCIRRNTKAGFGSSVVMEDYEQVDRQFMLNEHVGQPFVLCTRSCLGGLSTWAKKKEIERDQIMVLIEKGDEDSGALIDAARADGYKIMDAPKAYTVAFQAADVAAWKFRTAIHNVGYRQLKGEEDIQNILRSMEPLKATVQKNGAFDKDALLHLCEKAKIPRRHAIMSA